MNFPPPILRYLLIACLWASPVLLHGEEDNQELRKRAEQGDADAQYKLGALADLAAKELGKEKAEKFKAGAVNWYRKAAEQGLADVRRLDPPRDLRSSPPIPAPNADLRHAGLVISDSQETRHVSFIWGSICLGMSYFQFPSGTRDTTHGLRCQDGLWYFTTIKTDATCGV